MYIFLKWHFLGQILGLFLGQKNPVELTPRIPAASQAAKSGKQGLDTGKGQARSVGGAADKTENRPSSNSDFADFGSPKKSPKKSKYRWVGAGEH